jgi:uncharacterized protein (TIGR02145 family)
MRLLLVVFFMLVSFEYSCAQKVTNITAEQVGQTIQVSYNLDTDSPCTISLFYSTDNGTSWQGPLKKVSGDVCEKILSGANKITWEVLNEMEQLKVSSVVFKVDARKTGLKEVKIGNQIWSAENLNTDQFANGASIPEAKSTKEWKMANEKHKAAWCNYENNPSNGNVYGKLYNFYAVADSRGLCPTGWHVPEDWEWNILVKIIDPNADTTCNGCSQSQIAGGAMKEIGLSHWRSRNIGATNSSGFTGLPGGYRVYYDGMIDLDFGDFGCWWSATQSSNNSVYYRLLSKANSDLARRYYNFEGLGFSVRCIKD